MNDKTIKNKDELLNVFLIDSLGSYQQSMGMDPDNPEQAKADTLEFLTNRLADMKETDQEARTPEDQLAIETFTHKLEKNLEKYVETMHNNLTSGAQKVIKRKDFQNMIKDDYTKEPNTSIHPDDQEAVFQRAMQVAASESIYAKTADQIDQQMQRKQTLEKSTLANSFKEMNMGPVSRGLEGTKKPTIQSFVSSVKKRASSPSNTPPGGSPPGTPPLSNRKSTSITR